MLEVTVPPVYTWVKRYEENGIKGLETRPGQGRKPIMDCSDEEAVRKAIEEGRPSVSKAREALQMRLVKKPATLPSNVFWNIGARYKRIRNAQGANPQPQLLHTRKREVART